MTRVLFAALLVLSAAAERFRRCPRCVHWQRAGREGRCLKGVEGVRWCSEWSWKGLRP
jgi:hypothetical protein